MELNEQDNSEKNGQTEQDVAAFQEDDNVTESDVLTDEQAEEVAGGKKKIVSAFGSWVHDGKWPWED